MRTALASVGLAVVVVLGLGGARPAGAEIQPSELTASDVVVEPGSTISDADRQRLEEAARELRDRGAPTKFAVVANRPQDPPRFAQDLRRGAGFSGNVLVLVPSTRTLGIGSGIPNPVIDDVFNRSIPDLRADPIGGTIAVAGRLADAATSASLPPSALPPESGQGFDEGAGSEESSDGGGWGAAPVAVPLILAGGVGVLALARRSTRRRAEADLADRQAALEPMIDALAAHITDVGSDLRLGGDRAAEAQPYYDEAVLAYGEVRDAMPDAQSDARTALALNTLGGTLERGLRAAVSARALLDGRPIPPPEETALLEGLCAFDPKHGRAVREMPVVTPSGNEAHLPVCTTCAAGLEEGQMPDVRRVSQRGTAVPYWQGAGSFGFGGGLFPMFGGFLGGMVLHDLFTPDAVVHDQGGFGDGDGGGWGGGDFGGGDFGGGDFGGGDFGGGGDF